MRYRHKKRGTEYVLIGIGKMQAEALLSALETIDLPILRERLDESLKRLALGGQSNG